MSETDGFFVCPPIKVGDNIALVNGTLTEKAERVESLIKKNL